MPDRGAGNGSKNCSGPALHTPNRPPCTLLPLRFSTNLRYLRIPSRFFPAIPTCWGYIYDFILALDGRDRLGLAFESSARGYRSPPGSPKRGLGRAPRCTPARGISLFASGGTWWRTWTCRTKSRLTGRAGAGVDRADGVEASAAANVRCRVAGKPSAAYIAGVPHKTADVRN
jgi:hypothetical protein